MSDVKKVTIPQHFEPRDYQLPLFQAFDAGKRSLFLVWPRQIGKDTSCWALMVKEAVRVPGNYFYVFPTKEDARRALWEKVLSDEAAGKKLLDLLPLDPKHKIVTRRSNQEMVLELFNNSTIRVIGLDKNPEAIRGISPTGVVFSEFAYSDPQAYKALIPALRRRGCWKIINSTPNGRNHFYEMYKGVAKNQDWYVSAYQALWPTKSGYVHVGDQEYFEGLVAEGIMSWDDIEREYGCSFATGSTGSYYVEYLEQAYKDNRIGLYPYDNTKKVYTYWDIGVSDSTAVWFVQYSGGAAIFIDYFEDNGHGTDYYARILANKGYKYGCHYLPWDADSRKQGKVITTTAQDFEESLAENGLNVDVEVLGKLGKQDGINAVRKKFPTYFFDSENCADGLRKLELYHRKYDRRTQSYSKDPVHDKNSHAADALRMQGIADDPRLDMFYKTQPVKVITDYDVFDD